MIIFWILFLWLPLVLYVLHFWKYNVKQLWVCFHTKRELELLMIGFIPPTAVIAFCMNLDDAINIYIWGNK